VNLQDAMELTFAAVGGAGLTALVGKRWFKSMTELGAETGVMARLQKEVTRLSEQNEKLAEMLNRVQTSLFELREEHDAVKRENAEFRHLLSEAGLYPQADAPTSDI
jgi:small-conductance mechanosensitive channel